MMFDHRLTLLAPPRQIGVRDWGPGHMHWLGEFAASETGLAAFRQVLVKHAQLPMLLVADTVDEDYRSEILPHVQGRARAELLARKLKQVFRNARFTGAWRQARETTGRRDDGYLLAALPDSDTPPQLPGNAADEIAKPQLYLAGQRILPREARLHVLLLDPSGQLDSAQAPLNADPAFSTRLIDMPSLARALRIPASFLAATPEVAPLAALAGEGVQLNLAPAELLQRHIEFRWRRGLNLAAGIVAATGLTLTAAYWLNTQDLRDQALRMEDEVQRGDARHAAIVRDFPMLATRPDQLGQTIALATQLNRSPLDVHALFPPLGQALAAHPEVGIKALTLQA